VDHRIDAKRRSRRGNTANVRLEPLRLDEIVNRGDPEAVKVPDRRFEARGDLVLVGLPQVARFPQKRARG